MQLHEDHLITNITLLLLLMPPLTLCPQLSRYFEIRRGKQRPAWVAAR